MKRKALAQIPIIIGLLMMAISIPVATKLVQQNQTNQGKAANCGTGQKSFHYGQSCCPGYVAKNCSGSGMYVTCDCVKKASTPTAATKSCKVCSWNSTRTSCSCSTQSVAANKACPASNCTRADPTAKPTITTKSCKVCSWNSTRTSCSCSTQSVAANKACPASNCTRADPTSASTGCGGNGSCGASSICVNGKCVQRSSNKTCTYRVWNENRTFCVTRTVSVASSNACPVSNCTVADPTAKPTVGTKNCKVCSWDSTKTSCSCSFQSVAANNACPVSNCTFADPTAAVDGACGESGDCGTSSVCVNGKCISKPTPTLKVCSSNVDYDKNGVINSLDMLKCALY